MTSFKGTVKEIEKTDRTMLKYEIKDWTEMDLASTILNKIAFASIRKNGPKGASKKKLEEYGID